MSFQTRVLLWFKGHGRDLPWRHTRDPYAILVSEVMLQQTQVHRVIPKYDQFVDRFPTFEQLAQAPTGDVIRAWAPLGYNRRAVRLHRLARRVVKEYAGLLPSDLGQLRCLEGVGDYTASAVRCFAHGVQVPVIDTNVRRVLGRFFLGTAMFSAKGLRDMARNVLPEGKAWEWNQALMDLGAAICTSRGPRCSTCPVRRGCHAADGASAGGYPVQQGRETRVAEQVAPNRGSFKGSSRYYRGRIVDCLRRLETGEGLSVAALIERLGLGKQAGSVALVHSLAMGLEKDGLVVTRGGETGTVALPP